MTSNRDKAAEIITPWIDKEWGYPEDNAESAADALAAAGVLAPDLPDEWVDAKELREMIDKLREDGHYVSENLADELEAILPTPPTPRPEDVPVGEPWLLEVDGRVAIGFRNDPETALCWMVMFRDDDDQAYLFDSDATLVARLVPETTEQADVFEFDPACTYRDREGDKWLYVEGAWRWANSSSGPIKGDYRTPPAKYGPYTRIEDTK